MMMLVAARALGDYNTVPYEHVPLPKGIRSWFLEKSKKQHDHHL